MKGFFITGTDTGCGKTFVTLALTRQLMSTGRRVAALKPVASGASVIDGQLRNEDALALQHAANVSLSYEQVNPYCFAEPIAPHLAAAHANLKIDLAYIAQHVHQLARQADVVLVEGVGGWCVPLNPTQDIVALAKELQFPVILVVGMRLGCLNHALLTAQNILQSGCRFAGWIANKVDPEFLYVEENISALSQRISAPCLGVLDFKGTTIISPAYTNWLEMINAAETD